MKKYSKILIAFAILMGVLMNVQAQAPYKKGIGVTVGNMQALSFKTFGGNHFAFQVDLGTKYIVTDGRFRNLNLTGINIWTLELNPNFMYEKNITKGLYLFGGGGLSLGYSWSSYYDYWYYSYRADFGKFGINAIAGLEYKLNIPLTLQIDFRPGYGLLFGEHYTWSYFDWNLCAGVRYTF